MSRSYDEKRDFVRMAVEFPVELYRNSKDQDPTIARCVNLSGGGLLIESDTELSLGSEWHADVISEFLKIPTLRLRTEVRRTEEKQGDKFRAGLKILEVLE